MSLGRSLTMAKKGSKYGFGSSSSNTESKRYSIQKTKISSPVALISTSSMLSYNSPPLRNSISAGSMSASSSGSNSPTSLKSPLSLAFDEENERPRNNHLSAYFNSAPTATPPPVRSNTTRHAKNPKPQVSTRPRYPSMPPAPSLQSPTRRPAWPPAIQPPKEVHSRSARGFSLQHPFGAELAQVAEMAEEMAGMGVGDAEEEFMRARGLRRFQASDYEQDIWAGMGGVFEDELPAFTVGWI